MRDGLFEGVTGWNISSSNTMIDKFIIRQSGMNIALEFKYKDENLKIHNYTVLLKRTETDDTYRGRFQSGDDSGDVSCKLFDYNGDILLFGRWIENNTPCEWWAILSES